METYWSKTVERIAHPALTRDLQADAAVIGGGMAGVLTAVKLRERGLHTVLLEADRLGAGQTEKTTAKVTAQHGLCYAKFEKSLGPEAAQRYARLNRWAVEDYEELIQRRNIDCDWKRADSYLYARRDAQLLEQEAAAARRAGLEMELTRETELPFPAAALRLRDQGRMHPLKLLEGLTRDLEVYEHTPVLRLTPGQAETPGGTGRAKLLIVATHYPMTRWRGAFFLRMHQERSDVIALAGVPEMKGMYLGTEPEAPWSFRPAEGALLLGGASFRTGMPGKAPGRREALLADARSFWPEARPVARWSAQDCMTLDGLPLVGRLSRGESSLLVATGFQKWGMTGAMAAARVLAAYAMGEPVRDGVLLSPRRWNLRASAGPFLREAGLSVVQLTAGVFSPPRCSHLGCRLRWNPAERTWDCPCHGSRFTPKGQVLDGPAQKDAKSLPQD